MIDKTVWFMAEIWEQNDILKKKLIKEQTAFKQTTKRKHVKVLSKLPSVIIYDSLKANVLILFWPTILTIDVSSQISCAMTVSEVEYFQFNLQNVSMFPAFLASDLRKWSFWPLITDYNRVVSHYQCNHRVMQYFLLRLFQLKDI